MAKSWLYRLFGAGRIPSGLRAKLEQEGVILLDEGIDGTITYKNFRAPGKAFGWKRQTFSGAVALTKVRFVAFIYGRQVINVLLDDPRIQQLQVTCVDGGQLQVVFDPAIFHDDWSGAVEVRLSTLYAPQLCTHLTA